MWYIYLKWYIYPYKDPSSNIFFWCVKIWKLILKFIGNVKGVKTMGKPSWKRTKSKSGAVGDSYNASGGRSSLMSLGLKVRLYLEKKKRLEDAYVLNWKLTIKLCQPQWCCMTVTEVILTCGWNWEHRKKYTRCQWFSVTVPGQLTEKGISNKRCQEGRMSTFKRTKLDPHFSQYTGD